MAVAPDKLRILCLHGYTQNATLFRQRTGSLRKALKSRVDFVYLDAPFEAHPLPGQDMIDDSKNGRSWWQWSDTGSDARPSKAAHYTGWDDVTWPLLLSALREHQPHGVLGFSQGATATALLVASLQAHKLGQPVLPSESVQDVQANGTSQLSVPDLAPALTPASGSQEPASLAPTQEEAPQHVEASAQAEHSAAAAAAAQEANGKVASPHEAPLPNLLFAIMIAGFVPRDPCYAAILHRAATCPTPSLFVYGQSDALVTPDRSHDLIRCFPSEHVTQFCHEGAHLVPTCSGAFKAEITAFLDKYGAGARRYGDTVSAEGAFATTKEKKRSGSHG